MVQYNRFDSVLFQAVANGIDITAYVTEASGSYDLSRRVSECSLRLTEWPAGVNYYDTLDLYAGLAVVAPLGVDDPETHGLLHRFAGYVWDPEHALWPMSSTMLGRGPLILAERQKVPTDEELDQAINPPVTVEYAAPGIDLSCNPDTGDPWRGQDMIEWTLGKCGLSSRIETPLQGTPHILGAVAFDQFVWARQESGLSVIEKIDMPSMGYRTYDAMPCCVADPTRTIKRTRMSMLPDVETVKATFWEGRDLFAGATLRRAPSLIRNCVRVQGYDPGSGAMVWVSLGVHPVPPPGVANYLDTEYVSSSLIEIDELDLTYQSGISAKEIADWTLGEKRHDWLEMTGETWRDDPITAGESVYVNAPHLSGSPSGVVNQAWWVQSIEWSVRAGKFRQQLVLRAPAYWTGPGSVLGNLQLGGELNG